MHTLMKAVSILLLILVILASCETLVTDIPESRLPKITSKLVVHSFISPQAPFTNVVVSESVPIFSDPDAKEGVIDKALVKISDGMNEVTLPFDKVNQLYRIDQSKFKIAPSITYTLSVSHGGRSVTAHCTVPEKAPVVESYDLDTLITPNPAFGQDTALTLRMYWQDFPGETNYYRVAAAAEVEYSVPDPKMKEKRIRNQFSFLWDPMPGKSEWQSDRDKDGSRISTPTGKALMPNFNLSTQNDGTTKPFYPHNQLISVTMLLYNADINYFKYHRSLQQRMDTENPLTEPMQIYGNIDGGLGCFGAYNAAKVIYQPE